MDEQRIPVTGRTAATTDFIVLIGVMRTDVDTAVRADVTGYDNCMSSPSERFSAGAAFERKDDIATLEGRRIIENHSPFEILDKITKRLCTTCLLYTSRCV